MCVIELVHGEEVYMDSKKDLKNALDLFYDRYLYEVEVTKLYENNEKIQEINNKLIELDKKMIDAYIKQNISVEQFKNLLEEYFYTFNEEICEYRKNDFEQGLMIGLALNKFSQEFVKPEMVVEWMNLIKDEE